MTASHGFNLEREEQLTELNALARVYRHNKTGAELLTISNDDENKAFGVTFRTPPEDSTGIAHILEHSVLCGSRKYPIKEPFIEMAKSSLKTFLNAMTYPDKTTYPVASTNLKDFYNLVDVYLDAVFFPLITPETLQQEGWHYEINSPDEPLIFKGVVFNEMKGAYSSPDSVMYRYAQQSLFPDTTYGHSSGGDPKNIPDLTYEQFKRFHETLYHPSNARIFFYGDDPEEERLRRLDEYLSQFEPITPPSEIALQQPFSEPKRIEASYPAPQEGSTKKGMVMLNWMVGAEQDVEQVLLRDLLGYIMLGNAGAPLRKALIDSGLGEDVTGGGYNDGILQHTFSVGMKGIDPDDADKVQELILETLRQLAETGFDEDAIAAGVNTFEFSLRENNTGSFPRGLSLMLRSLGNWLYNGDPLAPLRYEGPMNAIRARLASGEPVFQNLIRTLLLQNTHRTTVLLRPDPNKAAEEAAEEQARLSAARAAMSPTDLEEAIAATHALKELQEAPDKPEDLAKIPTLTLGDLDREGKTIPIEVAQHDGATILTHDLFTNGIVYLELAFDLMRLPTELLPLVPLFSRALTEMGTEQESFVKLLQRIGRDTGGIGAFAITDTRIDSGTALGYLVLRGKATMGQAEKMLQIMSDVLSGVKLDDRERFKQMVLRSRAGKESSLVPSGNAYASRRIGQRLSAAAWADEQMNGISSLFYLRELEKEIDSNWPGVLAKLEQVRSHLINRSGMVANVTLDGANYAQFEPLLNGFLAGLPSADAPTVSWNRGAAGRSEGLTIPAKVNYVAKGVNLYDLGLKPTGAMSVVLRLVNTGWLWEKVRMQGGAYGAGSSFDRATGSFGYTSYRDPNLLGTLEVFDGTANWLRQINLDGQTIERSIIGTIGAIDSYQLPDSKGYSSFIRYLTGITDEYRQARREEVLATSAEDFRVVADILDAVRDNGIVAVIGSAEAIAGANEQKNGFLEVVKVL
jgi:presequence protease